MTAQPTPPVAGTRYVKAPRAGAAAEAAAIGATVAEILRNVREGGDDAVRRYSRDFDKTEVGALEVTMEEREAALAELAPQTRADTEFAIGRVKAFAQAQLATILPLEVEALPGLHLSLIHI